MKHSDHRPIVCGTDFSTQSQEAANVAAAVAARLGTTLLLAHGVDERGEIPAKYWPSIREALRPQLVAEAARLRLMGVEVEERLPGGVPEDGVAVCAERADARLIVLAASGHGLLGRWMLGSISEHIAESAWVPTLVLRQTERIQEWARGGKPLRVFVAADFTVQSDAALSWAAELRDIGPCNYTVGFVDRLAEERAEKARHAGSGASAGQEMQQTMEHDLRERAQSFLPGNLTKIRVLPASGEVETRLIEMANEASADLLVVGTHQWRGFSRLRHPSVSRRLLRAAQMSVACVPSRHVVSAQTHGVAQARQVVVAADLTPHGNSAIPHAFGMMQLGGTAWLLHVTERGADRQKLLDRLKELIPEEAEQLGFKVEARVVEGEDVPGTICEMAQRWEADLICVGARGSGRKSAVVAHEVIHRSPCPVLVIPAQTLETDKSLRRRAAEDSSQTTMPTR